MRLIARDDDCLVLRKQTSPESFSKGRSRMKVPDVGRNLVLETWTADGESTLSELGPCPLSLSHSRSGGGGWVTTPIRSR